MAQPEDAMDDFDDEADLFTSQMANNGAQRDSTNINEGLELIEFEDAWLGAAGIPDAVHGTLSLHPFCERVRFTPQFQRLDGLRQLGVAYRVFPSAVHTRLAHSLGVSHLCFELLRSLQSSQRGQLELDDRDVRNVTLAGLCHDLGHGPLSHVFEKEFLRRSGITGWEHEDMSLRMLQRLIDDGGFEEVEQEDVRFMERLIKGAKPEQRAQWPSGKRFLFDIVSNDQNGVDMDRADYMQRDALMCGQLRLSCNFWELISQARVVDDQICYPTWQIHNVWQVYSERVRLFREVYTHRRTKAAELMAVDALMLADPMLRFSQQIHCPKAYVHLKDDVLSRIERYDISNPAAFKALSGAEQKQLREAQHTLGRLIRGDMYDCCGECEVPERLLLDGTWEGLCKMFRDDILASYDGQLRPSDVLLDENRIDYGKGGIDPMAKVGFYDGDGDQVARVSADLSGLQGCNRPKCFKIRTLRVFVRKPEQRGAASAAFKEWCRRHLGADVPVDTDMVDERDRRATVLKRLAADSRVVQRMAADPRKPPSPLPAAPAQKKTKRETANNTAALSEEV